MDFPTESYETKEILVIYIVTFVGIIVIVIVILFLCCKSPKKKYQFSIDHSYNYIIWTIQGYEKV